MLIKFSLMLLLAGVIYSIPPASFSYQVVAQTRTGHYTCPMHPDIVSSKPGRCPKCRMALRYTKNKPAKQTATPEPASTTNDFSVKVPDVIIQDQHGKSLKFYSDLVKGRVVAVNFVFTSCTAICPPLTATFRRVQQELAAGSLKVQLISISVDPATDTPERLQAFASKFKAEPGWTFVTGSSSDIDSLLKEFGVAVANKNDHTPMILIGNDETGYWTRAYGLSSPTSLVKLITEAANRK